MGSPHTNPLGVEWFGLVMGLGFVLSFGYWCTDFLVVQRAMAADSMNAARRTPLIAALPKMVFPFLVILPGMIAIALPTPHETVAADVATAQRGSASSTPVQALNTEGKGLIPAKIDETTGAPVLDKDGKPVLDYDLAVPNMLLHYFPTGILGLGLTALLASFMSGMAGNVTAFNTVWTYDIYQSYIHKGASDQHYLRMGHIATVFGIALSIGAAYATTRFNDILDFLQLVFAFVNAPLFATFLLGMFWKRTTGHGAFFGLLSGTVAAAVHHGLTLPEGASRGNQRRLDHNRAPVSERHGAKFLDRDLGVDRMLLRDDCDQHRHAAAARKRACGPGVFADGTSQRRRRALVPAARISCCACAGPGFRAEYDFPVEACGCQRASSGVCVTT